MYFYVSLRATARSAKRVLAIVKAGVRLSVCLSVTACISIKTVQIKITKNFTAAAAKTLVLENVKL